MDVVCLRRDPKSRLKKSWVIRVLVAGFLLLSLWTSGVSAAPKGNFLLGLPADPTSFDPHIRTGIPMFNTWPMVFDNLLSRTRDGKIAPGLATSWKLINPTVWEFKLRKGVKFHNGEPVNAEAVKYSLGRIFDPKNKSRMRSFYSSVKEIEVVDEYTVRIHTKHPDRYLLGPLSDFSALVPPKYYKSHPLKDLSRHPVGSGPYRLVRWRKGSEMVFEAVPGYWDPSRQNFKTVTLKIIPEPTTRVSALVAGSVDMVKDVPPQMASMVESNPGTEIVSSHGPKACFLIMVMKKGAPWTNLKVRQAANYAINKESIIKNVLQGHASIAKGTIVGPSSYGHNPDLKPYAYNLEKAKKLMAEAGYSKGFSVELFVPLGRYLKGVQGAEAIAGQLARIGIKAQVRPLEYAAWRRNSRSKWEPHRKPYWNYTCRNDVALHSAWMFGGAIYSKSTHGGLQDKEIDRLINEARAEPDQEKQIRKYQELNRIIRDRALLIFLYHLDEIVGKKKSVEWKPRSTGYVIATDAKMKK